MDRVKVGMHVDIKRSDGQLPFLLFVPWDQTQQHLCLLRFLEKPVVFNIYFFEKLKFFKFVAVLFLSMFF